MDPIEPSSQQDEYQVLIQKGKAALEAGEAEAAKDCFQQALTLKPHCADTLVDIGNIYLHLKDFDVAGSYYAKAFEIDNLHWRSNNNLGIVYTEKAEYDKALHFLERAYTLMPDAFETLMNLGRLYSERKEYTISEQYYTKALETNKNNFYPKYSIGIVFFEQGKWQQVFDLYNGILNEAPDETHLLGLYHYMAESALKMGQLEYAIPCYQRIIDLRPDCVNYYLKLADMYIERWEISKAIPLYIKVIELHPETHEYWQKLSWLQFTIEKNTDAVETLQKALALFPNEAYFLFHYCRLLFEQAEYERAAQFASQMLHSNTNNPDHQALFGFIQEKNDNWEEALEAFQVAYECAENTSRNGFEEYLINISFLLKQKGLDDLADQFEQKAHSLKIKS